MGSRAVDIPTNGVHLVEECVAVAVFVATARLMFVLLGCAKVSVTRHAADAGIHLAIGHAKETTESRSSLERALSVSRAPWLQRRQGGVLQRQYRELLQQRRRHLTQIRRRGPGASRRLSVGSNLEP